MDANSPDWLIAYLNENITSVSTPEPIPSTINEKLAAINLRVTELTEFMVRTQNLETRHQELATEFNIFKKQVRDGFIKIADILGNVCPQEDVVNNKNS